MKKKRKPGELTPCARTFMKGTTPSAAMHWRMRGDPYKPPMQLEMDDTYRPARKRNFTIDTCATKININKKRHRLNSLSKKLGYMV